MIGRAVGRAENVVRGSSSAYDASTWASIDKRQVHRHLVAVEVGVEAFADQRVELDGVSLDQGTGSKGLNAHAVQRRSPVETARDGSE